MQFIDSLNYPFSLDYNDSTSAVNALFDQILSLLMGYIPQSSNATHFACVKFDNIDICLIDEHRRAVKTFIEKLRGHWRAPLCRKFHKILGFYLVYY